MPQLKEILDKRNNKSFVKKKYRPWDLSGNNSAQEETTNLPHPSPIFPEIVEIINQPQSLVENNLITKSDNIKITNREHKDNTQITQSKHFDNTGITQRKQLDNHLDNDLDNNLDVETYMELIKKLAGIQEKIFFYIVELCCARGTLDTDSILTMDIATAANCSYGSSKMSLKRLIDKRLIIRKPGKRSKGGHINLSISKEIRTAALQIKQDKQYLSLLHTQAIQQMRHIDNDLDNDSDNNRSINNNNIKIIISDELPEEWKAIDYEPLAYVGFSETQLKQIYRANKNSLEVVQESIYHFAYALENRREEIERKYKGALNALMSVLVKGNAWFEAKYESPQDIALKQLLSKKKADKEKRESMEKELMEIAFSDWQAELDEEQKLQYLPEDIRKSKMSAAKTASLRNYFVENIWPTIKIKGA
jgi:hypothetical protein